MAATQLQLRRGTSAQCAAMTPVAGEPIVNTTDNRIHVGDGSTAGGIILPNYKDLLTRPFTYVNAAGTANALTITLPITFTYAAGCGFSFKATATNTLASPTINVNGLGALTLKKSDGSALVDLAAGDLINGVIYDVALDGTYAQVLNISAIVPETINQFAPVTFTAQSLVVIPTDFSLYTKIGIDLRLTSDTISNVVYSVDGGSNYSAFNFMSIYANAADIGVGPNVSQQIQVLTGSGEFGATIEVEQNVITGTLAPRCTVMQTKRGTSGTTGSAFCQSMHNQITSDSIDHIRIGFSASATGSYVVRPQNRR